MFCGVFMIMVFDPQILFNDGFYPLMEVRIPKGSILKPMHPAALSCRTHALGRIFDVISGLLGQGSPDFLVRRRFLRQPPLHVFGLRQQGRVVSALPDQLRWHPRPPDWRRPRRAFALAELHQRSERIPRELLPATHRALRDRDRQRWRRSPPRRQCTSYRLPLPRGRRDLDPRRSLVHLPLGRERRRARRTQSQDLEAHRWKRRDHAVEVRPHRREAERPALLRDLGRRRLGRSAPATRGDRGRGCRPGAS